LCPLSFLSLGLEPVPLFSFLFGLLLASILLFLFFALLFSVSFELCLLGQFLLAFFKFLDLFFG
jgi:hypothetical protein